MNQIASKDYVILGLNHKTAPIEVRERLSFPRENLPEVLRLVSSFPSIDECFILSTCNRVEIHAVSENPGSALSEMRKFFMDRSGLGGDLLSHLYTHTGPKAVHHLFRVTSSLDSMIIGEAQITGQVKTAFHVAHDSDCARIFLKRLLDKALSVAKRIRTDTVISSGSVSFGSVAADLGESIFEQFQNRNVVLIGAGKIGALVVEAMGRKGIKDLWVLNRTLEKAAALAGFERTKILNALNLEECLLKADTVIASIEGETPLLDAAKIDAVMKKRKNRPLLLIDLGLPRNISPAAGKHENVYLYDIDDLQTIINKNLSLRAGEALKAEAMAEIQAGRFYERIHSPRISIPTTSEVLHSLTVS